VSVADDRLYLSAASTILKMWLTWSSPASMASNARHGSPAAGSRTSSKTGVWRRISGRRGFSPVP